MKIAVTQRTDIAVLDSIRDQRHGWLARALTYCVVATLVMPVVPASYAAGIVTDPNAEVRFQPQVNFHNSVPVVNIVEPDNTGLSHNQYEQFNVDEQGAVLNNSLVSGSSRLAAEIIANPNFNGVAATTILNEVTSSSDTNLLGALEVFGQAANVIIANRNGITCNDCGFINTDRITLTTGVPQYIGNSLFFDITSGTVTFAGEGVDHKLSPEVLDIVARYIDVDGEVQSSEQLNLITGALSLNYSDLLSGELAIDHLDGDTTEQRSYAIDASIFGAMQSGRISVMATEEGLGVRSDSYLFSQSDSLFIDSAGDIELRDADSFVGMQISSPGHIGVSEDLMANTIIETDSESFSNVELSEVTADVVRLRADADITLNGEVNSRQTNIDSATANVYADLITLENIEIDADAVTLSRNEVVGDNVSVDSLSLDVSDAFISAKDVDLVSAHTANMGDSIVTAEKLLIESNNTQVSSSTLQSNALSIISPKLSLSKTELISPDVKVFADSAFLLDVFAHTNDLDIDSKDLTIASSDLIVKDIDIDSDEVLSRNNRYQAENVELISNSAVLTGDAWQVLQFDTDPDEILSTEKFSAQVGDFELIESMLIARNIELHGSHSVISDSDLRSDQLLIQSPSTVLEDSRIRVTNNVDIDGQNIVLKSDVDASSINIDGNSVLIGGKAAIAERFTVSSGLLEFDQADVNARSVNIDTNVLATDLTTITSRIFDASVGQLFTTHGLELQSQHIIVAAREVELDTDTEMSSQLLSIQTQKMDNEGDIRASVSLELDVEQSLNNSGKLIAYNNLDIEAGSVSNSSAATISAARASIVAENVDNYGQIGSDYLFLDYDKIRNSLGAHLSAEELTLAASSEQSLLYNAGSISVGQMMGWTNEPLSAGTFINGGALEARNLDVTGLNKLYISDPNNSQLEGSVTIANKLSGVLDYFNQGGSLNADNLHIEANEFIHSGTTEASMASLLAEARIVNSGDVHADTLIFRTASLTNEEEANLTGHTLVLEGDDVTNSGAIGAYDLMLASDSEAGILVNSGAIVQRNEYDGQEKSNGAVSIGDFTMFSNEGVIETDGHIKIDNIVAIENGQSNQDASIVSLGDFEASRVGSMSNAGLIVSQKFALEANELTNEGKLSLLSGDVSIRDTIENDGVIYQRDEAANGDQVSLVASTFINGENAATDIIRGVLDLSSGSPGTLINKGLLAERKDAANSGLAMRGIGSLQNSGQISMSSEFAMSGGDFHNEGADAYIGVGVLRLEALQSLANDGNLVYDADSTIAANQLTNQGVIASTDENPSASLAVDAQQLANAGRISTSGELALNQTVSGRVSNAGLLYGDQVTLGNVDQRQLSVVNSGVNSLDAQGELVAGGIQSKNGPVEIVTQSFANHDQNTQGQVTSGNELKLDVSSAVDLQGTVEAAGAVALNMAALDVNQNASVRSASGNSHITVAGDANIAGDIQFSGNSQLNAGRLDNSGQIQGNQLGFAIGGQLNNRGTIVTDRVTAGAGSISNSGQLHGNQQVTLTSTQLNNAGQLTSANRMSLNAHGGSLSNSGTVNAIQLNASANRISTGAGSLINAQDASLQASQIENRGTLNQAQGSGQFILSADAIANLGASALMDISRGSLQASELSNEGTIVSERGSDAGQLIMHPLESLDNSGQLFAHSDLQVTESLTNSGKLQVKDIAADGITSFSNSGDLRAENAAYIASSSDLINEGNLIANEVTLNSQRLVTNSGLVRADSNMVIEANKITNAEGAEISTSNDSAGMTITARQSAVNQGNIIAKGDIDLDVAHFDNRGNMTATQTGTLKLDSLNNNGYIYGKDIVVGSQNQYITEDGLAGSQGTSGNVTGLYADNSLTMFVQGLLKATYQSKLITLNSDQDLEIGGNVFADDILNIDAKGLTVLDTGIISINGFQPQSTWEIDGDLVNQGSITSLADLTIHAMNLTNESDLATQGLLDIQVDNLTNSEAGVISGGAGLAIKGNSTGRVESLANSGSVVSGDYLNIDADSIINATSISAKGGSWNFDELTNETDATIVNLGDHTIGSATERSGDIHNYGSIFALNADYHIGDLVNHKSVYTLGNLTVDSLGSGHEEGGVVNKADSYIGAGGTLNLTTSTTLTNLGTIQAGSGNNVIGATVINNGDGSNHTGIIDAAGNLSLQTGLFNNYGFKDQDASKRYYYKIIGHNTSRWTRNDPTDYYWQHKVRFAYGEVEGQNHRSSVYSGGNIDISGSLINKGSDVYAQNNIDVVGSIENVSDTYVLNTSEAEFRRKTHNSHSKINRFFDELRNYNPNAESDDPYYYLYTLMERRVHRNNSSDPVDKASNYVFYGPWAKDENGTKIARSVVNTGARSLANPFTVAVIRAGGTLNWQGSMSNNGYINSVNFNKTANSKAPGQAGRGNGGDQEAGSDAANVDRNWHDNASNPEQGQAQEVDTSTGYAGPDSTSGFADTSVTDVDPAGVDMPDDAPDFKNGVAGPNLLDLSRLPQGALALLSVPGSGFTYDQLNALTLGGDKDPAELANEDALRSLLAKLNHRQGENSDNIEAGQGNPFGLGTPTLYDLPEEVRDMVLSALNYDPNPNAALDSIDAAQRPQVEATPLYNPIEEAELIRQAAMRQSGNAYFSNDWTSAKQQRDAMFDNTLNYLEQNKDLKLGDALTAEQVASLDAPLLWYTRINIGGQDKLVPTAYLPEATLAQITVPTAGTIDAETMNLEGLDEFANTGTINVKGHASIDANSFRNERLTQSLVGDETESAMVDDGGNINAGSLAVKTTGDINNLGGSMKTEGDLTLDADGNVNLAAIETREYNKAGKNIDEKNGYVTSTIEAGGNAELIAGGDINSQAADVTVEGDLGLDAENINLLGVTEREYKQRYSEDNGRFSSSEKTEQWETQTFKGTTFDVGGNTSMTARNDINMVGTTIEGDGNIGLKAGNDVLITAGISQESYSKEKSGEGAFTTSGQQKGHITQTAVGSNLNAGGNLTIDSDGGDVSILGSTLRAEEDLKLGDMKVLVDENNKPILDENGQYITEDGESIANLTIGSVELKDEEWNEKQSGLKGPLKKLAQVAAFTLSATGVSQQMQALGIDTEITIARSESERTETTRHVGSTTTAGGNLLVRLDEHLQVNGSELGADEDGLLQSKTASYDATIDTTTHTQQRSEETVSADEMALSKDELTVASATHTDHTETETTVTQSANRTQLNFGSLTSNTVGDTEFNGVLADIKGSASITGGDVRFGSASTTDSKVSEEHTVETSYSVGVRNAYVDAAYAAEAVAEATNAVGDAQSELDKAKRRVKDGTLAEDALDDYRANLAAAQAQLTNATIALGAAGATAAGSSGTGGFYASAGVNRSETSKQSSESHTTQHGSEFKVGGSAFISARDGGAIDIIGSSLDVGEHLSLDADDVNILASADESHSSSSEQSRSAGFSVSTSGADGPSAAQQMAAASGSANVNAQNSDSDSYSKTYNNSSIKAGSFSSTSENLHLAGANVEITGDIDITTDNLIVESLQNESRSSHSSEGHGVGVSSGGSLTGSYNTLDGSSERAWVDSQHPYANPTSNAEGGPQKFGGQSTLIGGGNVNINAKNTEVHGAVVANAVRNEDGSLTDLGNLNLITDELIVTDINDTDVSESSGFNVSATFGSGGDNPNTEDDESHLTGSTTVGLTNQGHRKEQTTAGTLGGGTITRRDGSEHDLGDTNRDVNNTQVVTLDQQTGGLNATVTVDHRLMSEGGREDIVKDFELSENHFNDEIIGGLAEGLDVGSATAGLNAVERKIDEREGILQAQQNGNVGAVIESDDAGATDKEGAIQALSDNLTNRAEVDQQTVALYANEGEANEDGLVAGFHQDSTNSSFINAGNTDMTSGADVAEVAVHETTHHILNEQDNGYTDEQKERAATADGDYARELWEQGVKYGDLASPAPAATAQPNNTGASDGKADWLAAQQGSDRALLDKNTATAAEVPSGEREEFLQFLLAPEAIVAGAGILTGIGVSLGLVTPEPDETGSGVMGHPAADMDVTGGFSTGGSPVAEIDTPSTETELRPEQGPTITTTPAANGDEVSPNSGGYVGKDVTVDDLLMMAEGLDATSNPSNITDTGTLTNIYQNDPSVMQSKVRTLVQDNDGRYWLEGPNGNRITPSGSYDFVTMPDGSIKVARPNPNPDYSTHLGLSGGGDVNFAGSIRFGNNSGPDRGTITNWSNNSGHYKPPAHLKDNSGLPSNLFKEH